MQRDMVSPEFAPQLGDRMDAAIGETSSGIGALLSELVRRSLRNGVSELGESLVDFAQERVDSAVERQMPLVVEKADSVATSASKRVIDSAVDELRQHSAKQRQEIEIEIQATETRVLDQSLSHLNEVVSEVRQSIDQTRHFAAEGKDCSERKIEELREKARQSWKKFVDQFTTINDAHEQLRVEHESLEDRHRTLQADFRVLSDTLASLRSQSGELAERLSVLEQPRGLKALLEKFKRNRPAE